MWEYVFCLICAIGMYFLIRYPGPDTSVNININTGQDISPETAENAADCSKFSRDDVISFLKDTIKRKKLVIENLNTEVNQLHLILKAPRFDAGTAVGRVTSNVIDEASGLCASRQHRNILYTHNDSGGQSRIFAVDAKTGNRLAIIDIDGVDAKDWEDIACGPCADDDLHGNCVYIGDVGGNIKQPAFVVYRIKEPDAIEDQTVVVDSMLRYKWSEPNCETVLVDSKADVYLVSKVGPGEYAKVVKLPKSAWGSSDTVTLPDGVPLQIKSETDDPVGGDISPDGNHILLKMYGHIWYWLVKDGDIINSMTSYPMEVSSRHERQGEAVCWDSDGEGYFTLAEGVNSTLWYFRQKTGRYPKQAYQAKASNSSQTEFNCDQSTGEDVQKYFAAFPGPNVEMKLVFASHQSGWAKLEIPEVNKCENISIDKGTTIIDIPQEMETSYLQVERKGIFIESPVFVTVYLKVNKIRPSISGLYDVTSLGKEYIFSNPLVRLFTVVATVNSTNVKISLQTGFRRIVYKGQRLLDGDDDISVQLNRLETFSVASPYMEITADQPVAVFTGPSNRLNQIVPIEKLDKTIVIPRWFSGLPYTIYTPYDDTTVNSETEEGITTYMMNKFDVDGGFVTTRSIVLSSDKPISVVFTSQDGTLYFPGINQYRHEFYCPLLGTLALSAYENSIHIIVQSDSINGLTINEEMVTEHNVRDRIVFNGTHYTYISVKTAIRDFVEVKSQFYQMFVFINEKIDGLRLSFLCV